MINFSEMVAVGGPYAFFFVLAGAARSTCITGLIDRPICLALLTGFFSSDWSLALPLGIILELLWLDALELGSIVPPYGSLSFLLVFPICRYFGLDNPGPALLPLILSMMAAYAASWCEQGQRIGQNYMLAAVIAWSEGRAEGMSPGRAVLVAGMRRALWQIFLYGMCFSLIFALVKALVSRSLVPALPVVTWPALYVAALLGAVLSLRTRQAYAVLVGTLGALALFVWGEG